MVDSATRNKSGWGEEEMVTMIVAIMPWGGAEDAIRAGGRRHGDGGGVDDSAN